MPKNIQNIVLLLTCAVLVLGFLSCAKKQKNLTYPAHGQVLDKNNKPAVGALIIFHPVETSGPNRVNPPVARVDDNGDFALTTYEKNDGGPEGEYIITITWPPQSSNPFAPGKEPQDRLQGRYSNPKTSKLKFKITNQPDNIVPPIHLQ